MINAKSFDIAITSRPRVAPTRPAAENYNLVHWSLASPIEAVATVELAGTPAEARGWSISWVYAISFNYWAIYRGPTPADGSVLLQIGNPPATALNTMIDHESAGAPFAYDVDRPVDTVGAAGQLPYAVSLSDSASLSRLIRLLLQDDPYSERRYVQANIKSGKSNKLDKARIEFSYRGVVALRSSAGALVQLGGLLWSVIWHDRFGFAPGRSDDTFPALPSPVDSRAIVDRTFRGPVFDASFLRAITGPRTANFNNTMERAGEGRIEPSEGWPTWLVRR